MNINELTTREKSAMLATAMGWHRGDDRYDKFFLYDGDNERIDAHSSVPDLYLTLYMPLAWRVLNWANDQLYDMPDDAISAKWLNEIEGLWDSLYADKATEAQAAWLDKILSLAIEAGMVQR